ncbi:Extracellular serine-rich protein [Ceratocystis lukuohia]|uniref:Extracellular serine-rich protein n=1 Tax=Ceratocystis lukuohia TaxID=2019550 RepID=A0ABR4MHE8_9PEZI
MRLIIAALIAAAVGEATIHVIKVTDRGFVPKVLEAGDGDIIEFQFVKGIHSVIQSSYENPCSLLPGGFASGLMLTPMERTVNSRVFQVPVTSNEPIWFYNGSLKRCHEDGHVGVVNPPASNSHQSFRESALRQTSTEDVIDRVGGEWVPIFE